MELARRIGNLQKNVFSEIDNLKNVSVGPNKNIIDLSIGSCNLSVSQKIIAVIEESLYDSKTHQPSTFECTADFRKLAANWYTKRYGISIDPETEVICLIGCQEGTAHIPLALLNPGDYALLQDPGYPSHSGGVKLADGYIYKMPLLRANNFLPIFEKIPESVLLKSRMMVLNYPHNPTTATAPLSFFEEAVSFCQQHNLALIHDFPYFDMVYDDVYIPPSVLQADQFKEISIEYFTFSKSYNMSGFRIGFAVGNSQLIQALKMVNSVANFNQYKGIINGAMTALKFHKKIVPKTMETLKRRRDIVFKILRDAGWDVELPIATMFIWAKLPDKYKDCSIDFCKELLEQTGVAVAPGIGFGESGEGYIRIALSQEPEILEIAVRKIVDFYKAS